MTELLRLLAWMVALIVVLTAVFYSVLKLWVWIVRKVFTGESDD